MQYITVFPRFSGDVCGRQMTKQVAISASRIALKTTGDD